MGSKKHKKHHKSDKKERTPESSSSQQPQFQAQPATERNVEQPLRLVLKVGGGGLGGGAGSASERSDSPHVQSHVPEVYVAAAAGGSSPELQSASQELTDQGRGERTSGAKHKKSKKKKKKKSSDRERKHRHHHHHHDDDGSHSSSRKRKRGEREELSLDESGVSYLESSLLGDDSMLETPVPRATIVHEEPTGCEGGGIGGTERAHHSREPRACTIKSRQSRTPLQHLLEHLLRVLEQRDPQQFFAWPVTDHIAPGYSSIIAHPMDFSTMRSRIEQNEYSTLEQFRVDLKLLCDNAMTYNHPETIYYRSAKRMLHVGLKSTSKEKLMFLRSTLSYINDIGSEALGFDIVVPTVVAEVTPVPPPPPPPPALASPDAPTPDAEDTTVLAATTVSVVPAPVATPEVATVDGIASVAVVGSTAVAEVERKIKPVEPPPSLPSPPSVTPVKVKVELSEDGFTPDEILSHARKAARAAADMLTLRRPNCKFGFLRQHKDGSTSLAILNPPGRQKDPSRPESRKVSLEMLVGRLHHGSGSISGYREDRRNVAKPVNYLNYGNYASYAPSNDSTFANLTKEDSDLLYSTYGDDTGVQYAESLLNFTKDCEFASDIADGILNALTDGEHTKVSKVVAESKRRVENETKKQQEELTATETTSPTSPPPRKKLRKDESDQECLSPDFDIGSLKTLSDEGIDMSFLDAFEKDLCRDPIQKKLDETTCLLQDLARVQNARLTAKLPHHLAHVPGPSAQELELAAKVTEKLTELSRRATPADLVNLSSIRDAMGITSEPLLEAASSTTNTTGASPAAVAPSSVTLSGETQPALQHGADTDVASIEIKTEMPDELPDTPVTDDDICGNGQVSLPTGSDGTATTDVDHDNSAGDLEVELREFLEVRDSSEQQANEMMDRALAL